MSRDRFAAIVVLLAISCAKSSLAADPAVELIGKQIQWLEEQAACVKSIRAEFSVTYQPTSPEAARLIAAVNQHRSKDPQHNIITPQITRERSYRATWVRQAAKEREERVYQNGDTETLVFDRVSVLRWKHRAADNVDARLQAESEVWVNAFHVQPCALAFEYQAQTLAEFLRRSPERDLARGTHLGQPRVDIMAENPSGEDPQLRLSFDPQGCLVAREAMVEGANYLIEFSRNRMRLFTRHEFSDHKSYDDGQGHAVWFPTKAVLHYYVGSTADGQPVEQFSIAVEVTSLELNVPIKDDAFQLVIPPGVTPRGLRIFTPFLAY